MLAWMRPRLVETWLCFWCRLASLALNFVKTQKVASGLFECPFPNSVPITLFAFFCPLNTLNLIGKLIKLKFQGVSRVIWLSLAFHIWIKPIFITILILTGAPCQGMKITRPFLPFMNECLCCGICQVSAWSLCTFTDYYQPELGHSSDSAWHFE